MSNPAPSPTPTKGRGRPKKEVQGIQKIGSFFKSGEKSNAGGKTRATKGKTRATKGKTSSFSSKAKQNQKEPQPPEIKRKPIASPKKITHTKDDDDESNVGDERESQEDYRYEEEEDEEYYDDDEDVELGGDEEDELEEEEDLKETHDNSTSLTNSNLKIKIKLSSSNPNLNVSNQNVNIPEAPSHLNAQNQRTLKMINLNLPFQYITQFYKENSLLRLGAMEAAHGHYSLESFNLKQLGTLKEQLRSIRDGIEKINSNVSNQLFKIDNITKLSESKTGEEMEDEGSNKITILKEEEYDLKGIDQASSHPSSVAKQTRKRQRNDPKEKTSQNIMMPSPSTPLLNSNSNLFNPNLSNNNLSSVHLSSSSTSLPSSFLKKESNNDDALSPSNEMILNDDDDEKTTKKGRNSENKKKKKTRGRAKQMRKKKKDKNKNTDDEMDYLDDLDDDDTKKGSPGYYNHANFWIHMKPYVQPITNDHLAFLQPTETANDPIFDIPTLGVKSKDSKKSNSNLTLNRNSTTGVKTTVTPITTKTKSGPNQPPNPESIDCGELTSRIFSALVQEKIIPETKKKLKYRFKKSELFQDYPVPYSEKATETIEERIRNELSDIGLIDMFSTPSTNNTNNTPSPTVANISAPSPTSIETDKDDENVTELKELQQKLLQQINVNNQNKKEILQLATQHMRREQQLELIQKERANVEKIFSNAFPKIKKKKK